jgi:glycosyltransferase involved in cell wall biosynthesis
MTPAAPRLHPPKVAVLIATRQRPRMLECLLAALPALERQPFAGEPAIDLEVVVVDNDEAGSSRVVCDACDAGPNGLPITYVIEPRAGIPFARNTALESARRGTDFFAFIDDDEVPETQWLAELLRVQRACGADMVAGPVHSLLPDDAPRWATKGRIFAHPDHATGDRIETTSSANVLITARVVADFARTEEACFDERLALTGGSDRHFFLRAHERGFSLVWAETARVSEEIPKSRARLPWVMKRMYRQGICNAFCEIDLRRMPAPRAQMAVRGALFIAAGLSLLPLGAATGSHKLVHYARYVAYGAGMLQAVRGRFYEEYKTVHGA